MDNYNIASFSASIQWLSVSFWSYTTWLESSVGNQSLMRLIKELSALYRHMRVACASGPGLLCNKVRARCRVKVGLHHTYILLCMRRVVRNMDMTFAWYTLGGTVCMVIRSCSWSNGWGLVLQFGSAWQQDTIWQFTVVSTKWFCHRWAYHSFGQC